MSTHKCSQCGLNAAQLEERLCPKCKVSLGATILPDPEATCLSGTTSPASGTGVEAGEIFGDYELLEEVARGGMGVIYKARHIQLNRIAALKMILSGRFSSDSDLQRFYLEAEAAATLEHPGIVPFYEIGEVDGQAFFAMKYVEGGSLAGRLDEIRQQPRQAIAMLNKVAQAVHHAHQRGILHRDLKPANILIDDGNEPLLTDLGLAKNTQGQSDLTNTGAVMGTPSYMPPEQAAGKTPVTTAADIYSLGAILYELLTGKPPHQGDSAMDTVVKVLNENPVPPSQVDQSVDRSLELICLKCLERDPNDRYESAFALATDLDCWLDGKAISVKPPTLKARAELWMRDNHRVAYSLFAILAGMLLTTPFLMEFLTEQRYVRIYDIYPHLERPWLFSLGQLPAWTDYLALAVIAGFGSSTGFLTALVARPRTVWRALGAGCLTGVVLYSTFLIFLGWMPLMLTSNSSWRVRRLAAAVWPTHADDTAEERLKLAEEIFPGLADIPVPERADAVVALMEGAQLAGAPSTLMVMTLVVTVVAIPLILGTALGWALLKRKGRVSLAFLRYQIIWWLTPIALIFAANALVGTPFVGPPPDRFGKVTSLMLACVAAAALYFAWRPGNKTQRPTTESDVY